MSKSERNEQPWTTVRDLAWTLFDGYRTERCVVEKIAKAVLNERHQNDGDCNQAFNFLAAYDYLDHDYTAEEAERNGS